MYFQPLCVIRISVRPLLSDLEQIYWKTKFFIKKKMTAISKTAEPLPILITGGGYLDIAWEQSMAGFGNGAAIFEIEVIFFCNKTYFWKDQNI